MSKKFRLLPSNTYYGAEGDILTLAVDGQHQRYGAGTAANPADFTGYNVDGLLEKVLPNDGVFTVQAEYKHFNTGLNKAALSDKSCFCMFDGDAYSATVLYLMPKRVGIAASSPMSVSPRTTPATVPHARSMRPGSTTSSTATMPWCHCCTSTGISRPKA